MKKGVSIRDKKIWLRYLISNKSKILAAIAILLMAGLINLYAGRHVDSHSSCPLSDIILDNIPVYEIGWVFVIGIFFVIGLMIFYPLLCDISMFCYGIMQMAFLILVRNLFIVMTTLEGRADAAVIKFPSIIQNWNFSNDMFFSGHVAIPFLGFFIFYEKKIKWVFLGATFIMAAVILVTHTHYSIDILGGLFIAYGCFKFFNWGCEKMKLNFK